MLHIATHPLVGTILRQINRPWDRFKIVAVCSGKYRSITWVTPGISEHATGHQLHSSNFDLIEIDDDQTDGPIDRPMPRNHITKES